MIPIFKKSDIVLTALLAILGVSLYFLPITSGRTGSTVVIKRNTAVYQEIPINKDTEIQINDDNGHPLNTITIKNGTVQMRNASCPDGLCVKQGSISKTGQIIICLPNKVVIEISGASAADVDAVVK